MASPAQPGFPPGFVWGAATSAYQIEGATQEDGRGESIWDRYAHQPGAIAGGATADTACDHYHHWAEDVALMRELSLRAYRFSIAWPRILPQGRGPVNPAGLDFYDRLVDALRAAGIAPYVTLYHWDLPQALDDAGGWPNRDTASAFAAYADVVARRLGDRVAGWITLNEPWDSAFLGYLLGRQAPGHHAPAEAWRAAHHLLLAHGLGTQALRAATPGVPVGIALNAVPLHPAAATPEDQATVQRLDIFFNRVFLDPLCYGRYPADLPLPEGMTLPVEAGDMDTIRAPLDFLGVNYYTRFVIKDAPDQPLHYALLVPEGAEQTAMGWEVYPAGLGELLARLHRDYPVVAYYVTENGAAFPDTLAADGSVQDPRRAAYLAAHIPVLADTIAQGVPVKGYFVWSLLDNFEWGHGYEKRFGLFYVDYPTQRRIWKDSARWYQQFLAGQRAAPAG